MVVHTHIKVFRIVVRGGRPWVGPGFVGPRIRVSGDLAGFWYEKSPVLFRAQAPAPPGRRGCPPAPYRATRYPSPPPLLERPRRGGGFHAFSLLPPLTFCGKSSYYSLTFGSS